MATANAGQTGTLSTAEATAPVDLLRCHECDLLLTTPAMAFGATARCPRCNALLFERRPRCIQRALGLTIGALVMLIVANIFPFMTFRMEDRLQQAELITGVIQLFEAGLAPLGVLVFITTILAPFLKLTILLLVLVPLGLGRRPPWARRIFRMVSALRPWAMSEVYLLGVFVAYVKLSDLATIELGPALFAFIALMVFMVWQDAALEPREVWERLAPAKPVPLPAPAERDNLIGCHECGLLSRIRRLAPRQRARCPRCGADLHRRKPESLSRTWALVITATILYVPANLFPVMTVVSFGKGEADTILSGVKALIEANMWPLALLVFFASITVPVLKLMGIGFLLVSVQSRSTWRPQERTRLYRVIEGVGRWSMIDIFMISILVALVKLEAIATIEPGVGATAFASVVVATMFAATAFDPRLIWDAAGANDGR